VGISSGNSDILEDRIGHEQQDILEDSENARSENVID
jgi:hypothetical protein